jgi:hypothetical protein
MTDSNHTTRAPVPNDTDWLGRTCLGSTCLEWSADGELTSMDLILVLERLARVDQHVAALCRTDLEGKPCPSIS